MALNDFSSNDFMSMFVNHHCFAAKINKDNFSLLFLQSSSHDDAPISVHCFWLNTVLHDLVFRFYRFTTTHRLHAKSLG